MTALLALRDDVDGGLLLVAGFFALGGYNLTYALAAHLGADSVAG